VGTSAAQYEFARAAHPDPKEGATCVDQASAHARLSMSRRC
jgi:hypothetical protein